MDVLRCVLMGQNEYNAYDLNTCDDVVEATALHANFIFVELHVEYCT